MNKNDVIRNNERIYWIIRFDQNKIIKNEIIA